jgi:hypothetical protein
MRVGSHKKSKPCQSLPERLRQTITAASSAPVLRYAHHTIPGLLPASADRRTLRKRPLQLGTAVLKAKEKIA